MFPFVVHYIEFMLSLIQEHFNLSLNDISEHVLSRSQVLAHYYCYFSLLHASEDLNWYHIKRKGETMFSYRKGETMFRYKLHCFFTDPQ